jgi:hypothetical protein
MGMKKGWSIERTEATMGEGENNNKDKKKR